MISSAATTTDSKICASCHEELALDAFGKKKSGAFGVTAICRACRGAKRRAEYAENRKQISEIRREKYRQSRGGNVRCLEFRTSYDPEAQWVCRSCGEAKAAISENYRLKRLNCRACDRAQHQARRKADPERERQMAAARNGRYIWTTGFLSDRPTRVCTGCGCEKEATPENFRTRTSSPSGLYPRCRSCEALYYQRIRVRLSAYWREKWRGLGEAEREAIRLEKRRYRARTLERLREYYRQWRASNAEEVRKARRVYEGARRARKRAVGGRYNKKEIDRLIRAQKNKCWYCMRPLSKYHVDHRIPLARGGANTANNLVLACPPCNLSKGVKMPWELENGRLL